MKLLQEMGRPRWEVAGNEMGRRIYHMTWDFQDDMGNPYNSFKFLKIPLNSAKFSKIPQNSFKFLKVP